MKAYATMSVGEEPVRVGKLRVPENAMESFLRSVRNIVGKKGCLLVSDVFLDENTARTILENKEKILRDTPKTYRAETRRILELLKEHDVIRGRILKGEGEIRDTIIDYIISVITDEEIELDFQQAGRTLAKYIPVKAYSVLRDSWEYVYDPSGRIKDDEYVFDYMDVEPLLDSIARRVVLLDIDERKIRVYGKVYRLSSDAFARVLFWLGEEEKQKEFLRRIVEESLKHSVEEGFVEKIDVSIGEKEGDYTIVLKLDPHGIMFEEEMRKLVEKLGDISITLKLRRSREPLEVIGKVYVDSRLVRMKIELDPNHLERGGVHNIVADAFDEVKEALKKAVPVLLALKELAGEKGYEYIVERNIGYRVPPEESNTVFEVRLEKRGDNIISSLRVNPVEINTSVEIELKKHYRDLLDHIKSKLNILGIQVKDIAPSIVGKNIVITGKSFKLENYEDAFLYAEELRKRVQQAVEEYLRR